MVARTNLVAFISEIYQNVIILGFWLSLNWCKIFYLYDCIGHFLGIFFLAAAIGIDLKNRLPESLIPSKNQHCVYMQLKRRSKDNDNETVAKLTDRN